MLDKFALRPLLAGLALAICAAPVVAQVRSVDPNTAIDSDLAPPAPRSEAAYGAPVAPPPAENETALPPAPPATASPSPAPTGPAAPPTRAAERTAATNAAATYKRDDLVGAAEGVFGKGAQGLAGIIERTLKEQGEPTAYIAGREAAGAIGIGLRYGSGTLSHKIEGQRPVYWTGPSIGFDLGADATKVFVLVYNLHDSQELYRRYPQVEGRAYFVGGFSATYLRRGDIVLIPVRLGVGVRLGANIGYMSFSEKARWLPF